MRRTSAPSALDGVALAGHRARLVLYLHAPRAAGQDRRAAWALVYDDRARQVLHRRARRRDGHPAHAGASRALTLVRRERRRRPGEPASGAPASSPASSSAWFDRVFVDGAVNGVGAALTQAFGSLVRLLQTGRIQQYAAFAVAGGPARRRLADPRADPAPIRHVHASHILSWITFLPLIGMAAILLLLPKATRARSRASAWSRPAIPLVLATLALLRAVRHEHGRAASSSQRRGLDRARSARSTTSASTGSRCALVWLTTLLLFIAVPASFGIEKARKAYYALLAAARGRHHRRVRLARLLPLLRVLGDHAAPDVLPDRDLGRPAARVRGDQVLPLHAGRLGADAGRDRRAAARQRARSRSPS